MSGWRWSPRVAAAVFAIVVAIQVLVPAWVYFRDGDHVLRFGWQMYSTVGQVTTYVVHTSTSTSEVSSARYMAIPRVDLPLHQLIPPHLCQVVEGAQRVTWDGGEHRC